MATTKSRLTFSRRQRRLRVWAKAKIANRRHSPRSRQLEQVSSRKCEALDQHSSLVTGQLEALDQHSSSLCDADDQLFFVDAGRDAEQAKPEIAPSIKDESDAADVPAPPEVKLAISRKRALAETLDNDDGVLYSSLTRYHSLSQEEPWPAPAKPARFFSDPKLNFTSDGYLTKFGAQSTCKICCRPGHYATACPELRCFLCYKLGHDMSACPSAGIFCKPCGRKGHSAENCPWMLLMRAAKKESSCQLRCARCGEVGHPMCAADGTKAPAAQEAPWKEAARIEKIGQAARIAAVVNGRAVAVPKAPVHGDVKAAPEDDHGRSQLLIGQLRRKLECQSGRSGLAKVL